MPRCSSTRSRPASCPRSSCRRCASVSRAAVRFRARPTA
jgi:hypothetical protein